jgi:1-acyl-sn-glycerol-3-phosphate acyltransferase
VTTIRACWKLVRALAHLLAGVLTILLWFPAMTQAQRQLRVQSWSVGLLACFSVKLQVTGKAPVAGPLLLVANHVSWLDITALHAACFCRFVAKAEVRRWPVIGFLAARAGTLFIARDSRRDALRVVHHMAQSLQSGDVLAIFPEGTTSDGGKLLPFHANLIQAAISAEAPVQALAISFIDPGTGQASRAPLYIGDDSLLGSVWRTLCTPAGVTVVINFGEPQMASGRNRRSFAADLRANVDGLRQS